MDTHDLAKKLLEKAPKEVTASIDISTCDEDHDRRIFGLGLDSILDSSREVTLLFTDFNTNYDT